MRTTNYKNSVLTPFCAGYSIFVDVIDHFLCFREYVKWYFLGVCFYSEERFFLIFLWNASFFCHKHVEAILCEVVDGNFKVANRFSFFASHFFNAFVGYIYLCLLLSRSFSPHLIRKKEARESLLLCDPLGARARRLRRFHKAERLKEPLGESPTLEQKETRESLLFV